MFYLYQARKAYLGKIHIDNDMLLPFTYWLFWWIYLIAIFFRFISTNKELRNNKKNSL